MVPNKKPAPDIYLLALARTGRTSYRTVVVEDSRNGLLAATAAGLACVVTVNGYTVDENFAEAALVVTSLGDPDGERAEVLENRSGANVVEFVTLDDLLTAMPSNQETGTRNGAGPASAASPAAPTTEGS